MKIGIISDTHDKLPTIDAAFDVFLREKVLLVVHCGDWKSVATLEYVIQKAEEKGMLVRGVLGNNDLDSKAFLLHASDHGEHIILTEGIHSFEYDGKKIAAYHGHHAPTLRKLRASNEYDAVCLGHTHKPNIEVQNNTLFLNPGSTAFSIPRSKTWQPNVIILHTETLVADLITL